MLHYDNGDDNDEDDGGGKDNDDNVDGDDDDDEDDDDDDDDGDDDDGDDDGGDNDDGDDDDDDDDGGSDGDDVDDDDDYHYSNITVPPRQGSFLEILSLTNILRVIDNSDKFVHCLLGSKSNLNIFGRSDIEQTLHITPTHFPGILFQRWIIETQVFGVQEHRIVVDVQMWAIVLPLFIREQRLLFCRKPFVVTKK